MRQGATYTAKSVSESSDLSVLLLLCEEQDGLIREAAVRRLGQLGNPEAIPALVPCVNDPLPQVCTSAAQALLNLAIPRNAAAFVITLPEIYALKASKIVDLHGFIIRLEKYLIAKENVKELLSASQSDDPLLAKASQALVHKYKLLQASRSATAAPAVATKSPIVKRGGTATNASAAAAVDTPHFLSDLDGKTRDTALRRAIKHESVSVRREAFLILLSAWGNEVLAKEFLFDTHFELREIAVKHLKSKGTDVQYTYLRSLSDNDESTLCCAIWGLAYLDSKECISQIRPFLKHSSETVRKYATNALTVLESADGRKTLTGWNSSDSYS